MYEVTWIQEGELFSLTSPSIRAILRVAAKLRQNYPVKVWYKAKGNIALLA